uniref:Uncharacterized protein n=1 Tax=Tanacetum cinerariifolium TaxID=118510 RepID=A0A699GX15_TANCI|nr:hypothetical protein [Tanacetum cinerariifolium]
MQLEDEEVEEDVQNELGDHEDYLEDDHEVNYVPTETDIGSTSHGTSVTRKESRALNEAKKRRVDKGKVVSKRPQGQKPRFLFCDDADCTFCKAYILPISTIWDERTTLDTFKNQIPNSQLNI